MNSHLDCQQFSSCVYAGVNFLLFITNRLNSDSHHHPALQINISLSGEIISVANDKETIVGECVIIGANETHRIISQCRWQAVLLLSSDHPLAAALEHQYLSNRSIVGIKETVVLQLKASLALLAVVPGSIEAACIYMAQFFQTLSHMLSPLEVKPDFRIDRVVKELRQQGNHRLAHRSLANVVALSNSHLSHLFRQEAGIALRRYRLWRRTMEGTSLILQGKSITDASIASGFSDTSHFSRSFKRQFGISPSALRTHVKEVIWLDDDLKEGVIL